MAIDSALNVKAPQYGRRRFSPLTTFCPTAGRLPVLLSRQVSTVPLTTLTKRGCSPARKWRRSPAPSTTRRMANSGQSAIIPDVGVARIGVGSKSVQSIERRDCATWS